MATNFPRRDFLKWSTVGGALAGFGDLGFLGRLTAVSAAEAKIEQQHVQFAPDMEPLVRLLEDTPRERLLEEMAARVQQGLTYREVLAALLLAGVRNVQPRPSVGFKFHAVLVVNSAHLASLSSPPEHRWLPIFWALDYFKSAQARDVQENNWTMAAVDEAAVPPAHQAREAFTSAMDNWDEAAADVAVASLARSHGAHDVYEILFRYGARDFRSIGHKAIFVANSLRTLQCIGWRYSEPVLRSLAYALLMHEGDNPAKRDAEADRPWRENVARAKEIRGDWLNGKNDDAATQAMLAAVRSGSPEEASKLVVDLLNRGVSAQSVWDGMLAGASELLVRQPGIVSLHTLTTSNAMHYAFAHSGNDDTRRMLMLQNAAFLPMFRAAMHSRGSVADFQLDEMSAADTQADPKELVDDIFADVSRDRARAAGKVLAYLKQGGDAKPLIDAARVLVFLKGTDSHDYKFSSAVLEDYYNLSPAWRDRFLAASVFKLRGSGDRENQLVQRTRAALG